MTKITFIGAGSLVFTRNLCSDILLIQEPVNRLAYDEGLPSAGNPRYLLKELNAHGVVPDAIIDTERNLSTVHYQVTSAQRDASPREAIEYAALTREVGRYLNSLRGDQDATPLPEGNA